MAAVQLRSIFEPTAMCRTVGAMCMTDDGGRIMLVAVCDGGLVCMMETVCDGGRV